VLVQIVMLLCCWIHVLVVLHFLKVFTLRRATRLADDFEKEFWSGADLNELYQRAVSSRRSQAASSAFSRRDSANSPSTRNSPAWTSAC